LASVISTTLPGKAEIARERSEIAQAPKRILARFADELDQQDRIGLADERPIDDGAERGVAARQVDHRAIDELDRRGLERHQMARAFHRLVQRRKVDHAEHPVRRQRCELQREPARPRERALAADEKMRVVDAAVRRIRPLALRAAHVDVVAADTPQHLRHVALDLAALALADRLQAPQKIGDPRRRRRHLGLGAEARLGAVRQDRIDGAHVVHHVAVGDRARAARVVAGHAPDRRLRRRADVDREPQSVRLQPRIERVEHDAGLDGDRHRVAIERPDRGQMLAVIDHERRADGLPALRAAGAASQHRHALLPADARAPRDIVDRFRHENADGLDLVDRRIGRIAAARCGIEQHVAGDGTGKSCGEAHLTIVEDTSPLRALQPACRLLLPICSLARLPLRAKRA
jgi:hypothetical protein